MVGGWQRLELVVVLDFLLFVGRIGQLQSLCECGFSNITLSAVALHLSKGDLFLF